MVAAQTTVPPRNAIAREHTWNAESVFETRAAWREEFEAVSALVPTLDQYKGHLGDSPTALADFFDAYDQALRRVYKLFFYAAMSKEVDSGDKEAMAMTVQASGLNANFLATSAFRLPELIALGRDKLMSWTEQEPRLAVYRQFFDDLFRRQAHVRSAEVEELLGMAADPFGMIDQVSSNLVSADLTFKPAVTSAGSEVQITQGTLPSLLNDSDRELRRTAWENFSDAHLAFKNTLAANYLLSVKRDVFLARAHRFESSIAASLFDGNVPMAVYNSLIDTFKQNLPTWHRYWAARRRALKVDTLHTYDIWAPLTDSNPTVPYEQGVEWIVQGMQPLGDEYVSALRRGCLEERWVDVYPNQGKRQGAFSFGTPDTHPFIMMSYTDNLNSVSTLAHELGHSLHSYFTWKNQPFVYTDYSLFVAEVASNFNQAMVRAHLLKTQTDPVFQIALLEEAMYNFHRYFFIMPTLARFELEVHERVERGQGLTADDLNNLMADLFTEAYGGEMHVDRDRVGITWATFGHLYSNFYVFQYATGISAAHALAAPILAGDQAAARRYIEFLSAGSSLYPVDALKHAGVDMTTPQAVETAFATMAGYVDRLEKLTT
jgi:oligoendopeptidase F